MATTRNEIKTDKIFIMDVFEEWYTIPEYQRPYVWGKDEITDLLDDISYSAENTPNNEYFLGSYVYQHRPANQKQQFVENDLLDGQQRITTLFLLFAVVRDLDSKRASKMQKYIFQEEDKDTNTPERIRLLYKIRPEVEKFINDYVKEKGGINTKIDVIKHLAENAGDTSIKNMSNAIIVIKSYFEEKKNIDLFIPYLLQYVLLIYVSSLELEDAFRLFTILNDRGIKLRNSDILKAQNLQHVPLEVDKIKYGTLWEEMEGELGEDFDRFMSFIRTIIIKEKARLSLLKEFEDIIYIPKEKDKSTGKLKKPLLNRGKETFDLLDRFYRNYEAIFENDTFKFSNGYEFNNLLVCMKTALPSTDWVPPLLLYYDKFKDKDIFKFLHKLDNKFSGDWISQLSPTERLESMNVILKTIETAKNPDDLFKDKIFNFDNTDFFRNIEGNVYGRRFAKYILLKLDYIFNDNKTNKWSGFNQITVEHILPQTPEATSQWKIDFTDIERSALENKMGNLILLGRGKNASQGRLDYVKKHQKYFANNINTFPNSLRVFNKYTTKWTKTEFNENQDFVIAELKKYYS
jgi:uncharacterized protein with ParB-like and HNH nuclease domain